MLKKLSIFIIVATTALGFIGCNKDNEDDVISSSNVMVTAFSLNENDKVLNNLDSVFFTIDLINAKIYNADSLPYGTKVSKLAATIATSGSSVAELHVPRPGKADTIIDYLKNSNDSIDFSHGPVKLHLVAHDKKTSRDYSIHVNVHKIKPDSLFWNKLSLNKLPSNYANPAVQKTIQYKTQAVCLTGVDGNYSLAKISNPANFRWNITDVTFPFTPNVNSLAATSDALYILDTEGNLYTSTEGLEWTACGTQWHHIYGGYGSTLLGVKYSDGNYYHTTYPESTTMLVDEECPISGTSTLVYYDNKWSVSQQAFLMGGRKSDGSITGEMWGYDGKEWGKVSQNGIYPREGMTFFSYQTFKTNTSNWDVTEYPTLIAFGGFDAEGYPGRNVFVSIDMGIHWKLADDLLQLPTHIPNMGGSQALVFNRTLQSRSIETGWVDYPSKSLPCWWQIDEPALTRASQMPNSWECPYIYLFGGYDEGGNLYNTVWRGVLNRLTFKPIF